jgi:hypothetical protein
MEALKGAAVAGERKAVASRRFSLREKKGCGEPGSVNPEAGKTALGEQNGESHGALKRGVQCRA